MSTISKLDQLRARTDLELVALIDGGLDRSLRLAQSTANAGMAEKLSAEARKLLPRVYNLSERLRLERKLRDLEAALTALSAPLGRVRAAAG
jgi:hypothetical protein